MLLQRIMKYVHIYIKVAQLTRSVAFMGPFLAAAAAACVHRDST